MKKKLKRICVLLTALCMTFVFSLCTNAVVKYTHYIDLGDVNSDMVIDEADINSFSHYLTKGISSINEYAADLNGDDAINVIDLITLKRTVVHNSPKWSNARCMFTYLSAYGLNWEQSAAVLGNLDVDSNIDPTYVEGFYGDDYVYHINDNFGNLDFQTNTWSKSSATYSIHSFNKYSKDLIAWYGDLVNSTAYSAKTDSGSKLYCAGIGLCSFTGQYAYDLMHCFGNDWSKCSNQMMYMLGLYDAYGYYDAPFNEDFFPKWKQNADDNKSVHEYTRDFAIEYEGVDSNQAKLKERFKRADEWYNRIRIGELSSDVINIPDINVVSCDILGESDGNINHDGKVYMNSNFISSIPCGREANLSSFSFDMRWWIGNYFGNDGNIKPELIQPIVDKSPRKTVLFDGGNEWWNGCAERWTATRISSYVAAKYNEYPNIVRFGYANDIVEDGECLGAKLHATPSPPENSVFFYENNGTGHTGFVEYISWDNSGIIVSETNTYGNEGFTISYVPHEIYKDWYFVSVDEIYEANKGSDIWSLRYTG